MSDIEQTTPIRRRPRRPSQTACARLPVAAVDALDALGRARGQRRSQVVYEILMRSLESSGAIQALPSTRLDHP